MAEASEGKAFFHFPASKVEQEIANLKQSPAMRPKRRKKGPCNSVIPRSESSRAISSSARLLRCKKFRIRGATDCSVALLFQGYSWCNHRRILKVLGVAIDDKHFRLDVQRSVSRLLRTPVIGRRPGDCSMDDSPSL